MSEDINPYQSPQQASPPPPKAAPIRTQRYGNAIIWALAQQAVVLILTAQILDGGATFIFCTFAVIVAWVATLVIIVRHPRSPTQVDLFLVKYGFWCACILVWCMMLVIAIAQSALDLPRATRTPP